MILKHFYASAVWTGAGAVGLYACVCESFSLLYLPNE